MASVTTPTTLSQSPRPAWEIAELFPYQGELGDGDYLIATRDTNRLAEFTDGYIELLTMPNAAHQLIVQFLSNLLLFFVQPGKLGRVLFAPLRVRLRPGKFREPDVVFMLAEHMDRAGNEYWDRADLVMEVGSDDDESRKRDLVTKRQEYAEAGIPEYWIIDTRRATITVLTLSTGTREYVVHGEFAAGSHATSVLLDGFVADVAAVFAAAKG